MTICVRSLLCEVTEDDLIRIFTECGTVKHLRLITCHGISLFRDFFVVDISSDAEETVTIEVLNDAEWMGCDLKINKSRSCES